MPFLAAGSEVVNCSLTRAIKASVEFDSASLAAAAAFLAEAAAFGGITTVLRKSSSSTSGLSSVAPSSAEPRSKSTGGLGGITLLAGGAFAAFAAGFIDGMGADPSGAAGAGERAGAGAATGAGSSIAGIGADANGDGLSKTTASSAGCESAAVTTGAGSSTGGTGADANGDGLSKTTASSAGCGSAAGVAISCGSSACKWRWLVEDDCYSSAACTGSGAGSTA